MNMIKRTMAFLILGLVVVGCSIYSGQPGSGPSDTPGMLAPSATPTVRPSSGTAQATAVESPRQTLLPTEPPTPTPSNPTLAPSVSVTPASLPIQTVNQHCLTVGTALPPHFLAGGTLVEENLSAGKKGELVKLSSLDNQPQTLPNVPTYLVGEASPNGKWLAYEHLSDAQLGNTLVTISGTGEINTSVPWSISWEGAPSWLDDRQVEFTGLEGSTATFTVVDPFSGQSHKVLPVLPGYFKEDSKFYSGWKAIPDATLTRVAYMRGDQGGSNQSLILLDNQGGRALWRLDKYTVRFVSPVWSPDGRRLAVIAMNQAEDNFDRFELFLVDRDGQAQEWVDLGGYYPHVLRGMLKWSPDGRYLAFKTWGDDRPVLLLDTGDRQLLDYCVSGGSPNNFIWSPDSTQVIVPSLTHPSVLIDTARNEAAQIGPDPNQVPVAWLATAP